MPKCPSCGREGLLFKTEKCLVCGKECCSYCGLYVLTFAYTVDFYVCSQDCYRIIEQKVLEHPQTNVGTVLDTEFSLRENKLWFEACLAILDECNPMHFIKRTYLDRLKVDEKGAKDFLNPRTQSDDGKHMNDLRDKFKKSALLNLARGMEAVGRPLDAAMVYEQNLKMYDKARELRQKERQFVVKRMDISVDLNELLQQVKDGGIVAVYRCPHCGGKLKIGKDTRIDSLRTCEYCGSTIEAMDIADFLRTVLS